MHVRAFSATDAPAFRRIRLEALQRHPEAFGASFAAESATDEAGFTARLAANTPPSAIFGAFDGDEIVGMAGFALRGAEKLRHKGVLWGVYLRDSHRGHGHGRRLVGHVIAHARAHVSALQATVVTANADAAALYRALGFVTYGIERDALRVDGRCFDEALIELRLGATAA